ncbi:carboxypeptidase-like regulatory domain-containing protein [Stieleria sp. TO1_6]|uniref:carboxypeptidase-like regulatory domain-containing protein n=1 Tax=Stieleria tagensis TaxID=2956795 RepID=UPI00209B4BC4|nr:carboxypeptidase-like regulatory domain-containing protein [Stieleria tagensis]MCO8123096.1 carboxypeptidase-like regulatory domain-containing protein [Stieleria tagensis]
MNRHCLASFTLAFIPMLIIPVSGCGNSKSSYQGSVRFANGDPVQSGSVEFRSLADGSRYASRIASDGSFALADQSGAHRCPPGDYEVVVVQIVLTEDLAADAHDHGQTVPRHYADYYTSGLRITNPSESTTPLQITLETSDKSSAVTRPRYEGHANSAVRRQVSTL